MKKIYWSLILLFVSVRSQAIKLQYIGETAIPTGEKFMHTEVGGLSAMVWSKDTLYAVSDDKGRNGEPRLYEFDFKIKNKIITLKPKAVHFIKGLPAENSKTPGLDLEGLVLLPNSDFLISSEGNNNSKPREIPRIFRTDSKGIWKSDLPVPEKYLPELIGQQKKGTQNNAAFEGLTASVDGKVVYAGAELPLTQDHHDGEEVKGPLIRIIKYEDKTGQLAYKPVTEYAYRVDALKDSKRGKEIFRGVSEILALNENKLLVLERGLKISPKTLTMSAITLYLADLSTGSDVKSLEKLEAGKFTEVNKTKIIDFETDLAKELGSKDIENFEALSFGPQLPDGRKSLLILSDNNFSKKQITRLLVFAIEGE